MNLIEELFISNSYSEVHRAIGFPVLVHKSVRIKDKFNQIKVSTIPALNTVYGVFAAGKTRDIDLAREDIVKDRESCQSQICFGLAATCREPDQVDKLTVVAVAMDDAVNRHQQERELERTPLT